MQNQIKKYRQLKNLTQQELANLAKVRRETIVFLEQGKYNPSLQLAHDVSQVLGVNINDLFIFDNKK